MLHGRFGESSGRPYVSARVFIPRLGPAGNVSFIFDTGADSSVLMPADAIALGVDHALLSNPFESFGIGGSAPTYVERARWRVTYDKSASELAAEVLSRDAEFPV